MKRFLSQLIISLLLVSTASANGFFSFNDSGFGFGQGSGSNGITWYAPLLSDLGITKGTGAITYTRASTLYEPNNEGIDVPYTSGVAAYDKLRIVTNLLTYSEDLSNSLWVVGNSATKGSNNLINLPSEADNVQRAILVTTTANKVYRVLFQLSGSGTVSILTSNSVDTQTIKQITLSSTPTWFSVKDTLNSTASTNYRVYVYRNTGDTATSVTVHAAQVEDVTAMVNQNPSEYAVNTNTIVPKYFTYANPFTVDANGVVTDSGARTSLNNLGIVSTAAVTNKVTCYSVPRADYTSAELNTGDLTTGTGYTVTNTDATHTVTFSGAGARFLSDTASPLLTLTSPAVLTVGKQYRSVISIVQTTSGVKYGRSTGATDVQWLTGTGTYTLDFIATNTTMAMVRQAAAADVLITSWSIKEINDISGTSAKWLGSGTAFTNPITNMTLSGDTAAVLSIVQDTAALTTALADSTLQMRGAIQQAIDNGNKVYKITTGAGGTADVDFAGAMSAVTTSDYILYRVAAGSMVLSDNANANATASLTSATWAFASKENFTATATRLLRIRAAANSQIFFLAPHLTETPYVPQSPYIPTSGAAFARSATVTSAAVTLASTGTRHIRTTWTPKAVSAGKTQYLASSYTDVSNSTDILYTGSAVVGRKRVSASNNDASLSMTAVVGTTYLVDYYIYPDNTTQIFVNGTAGTANSNTTAPVIGSTVQWGSQNGVSQVEGFIKNVQILNR